MVSYDDILGKKDKIILGTFLGILFAFLFILNHLGYFENKKRDRVLNENFNSLIIKEKISESSGRKTNFVVLSDGTEIVNYFPEYDNLKLTIGDSLVKLKNSTDMQVFRDKHLIYSINLLK